MGFWHAETIKRIGGEIVAVIDSDHKKADTLTQWNPKARMYSDIEQALAVQILDVLHICMPANTHQSLIETAIEVGCHVLIEKPVSATAAEMRRVYSLAEAQGVMVCPVHQFPFQDGVLKAKETLGNIGRLLHIGTRIYSAGGEGKTLKELEQTIFDILPHPLSLIQTFDMPPLAGIVWQVERSASGELMVFGHADAVSLLISISMNARPTANTCELTATAGTVHLDLLHGYATIEPGEVSRKRKALHPFAFAGRHLLAASSNLARQALLREPAYPGLRRLFTAFYDAVKGKSPPPFLPEDVIDLAVARDNIMGC